MLRDILLTQRPPFDPGPYSASDPYWSNIRFLLRADAATEGSTAITDAKSNTIQLYGGAQITIKDRKYGTGCLNFSGVTGRAVACPTASVFQFSAPFTNEGWFLPLDVITGDTTLYVIGAVNNLSWDSQRVQIDTNGNVFFSASSANTSDDIANRVVFGKMVKGVWNHFAVCWDGSTYYLSLNRKVGAKITSSKAPYKSSTYGLSLGNYPSDAWGKYPHVAMNGYLDEFCVTAGVARYTTDY